MAFGRSIRQFLHSFGLVTVSRLSLHLYLLIGELQHSGPRKIPPNIHPLHLCDVGLVTQFLITRAFAPDTQCRTFEMRTKGPKFPRLSIALIGSSLTLYGVRVY